MRRLFSIALFLAFLLDSCAPQPDASLTAEPTSTSSPTEASPPAHAPEIRFALIGKQPASHVNVWELFDESGASYANYALHSEYWPRLYYLAFQDSSFEPFAAKGPPSEVTQDGGYYSATVQLRPNLKWTDGSSFTAEDVAFTVDTALAFGLGYDWSAYYPREYLDHVEAVDSATVKFFFKQKPNVGVWQYGALQGPIVQRAFWESAIKDAAKLLPADALQADIDEARVNLTTAQVNFAEVSAQVLALRLEGKHNRKLDGDLVQMQGEVTYRQSNLDKLLEDYARQVESAQQALYAVNDDKEPTLGTWMPAGTENNLWVNNVNPDFPFGTPNFDRATYRFFENENSVLTAFQNGEVDFILSPDGVSSDVPDTTYNSSYSARFLMLNPLNAYLANPTFRSALDCMIDRKMLATDVLQNKAAPLDSFVLSPQWHDANLKAACVDMDKPARVDYAVRILKDAGYSWTQGPTSENAGQNLLVSDGGPFPKITLLVPSKEEDVSRNAAAKYIAEQAQYLGIPVVVQEVGLNDVVYAVYSSQKYDMALMGWQLSEYPSYLCEWFEGGGKNLFLYNSNRLGSACSALGVESNLSIARQTVGQIEAALMSELPFIPLFTVMRADVYHNISYPVPEANILYGAPSYAIPAP